MRAFNKRAVKGNPNECWIWKGYTSRFGYGEFVARHILNNGERKCQIYLAHRFAWMMHYNSPIPKGLFCCHSCDVRNCINPFHLMLGTAKTNSLDSINKDRKMKVKRHVRLALADAIMGGIGRRKASKLFNIPLSSILYYLRCKDVRDKYGIIDLSHRSCKKKVMHGQTSISDTPIHSSPNTI